MLVRNCELGIKSMQHLKYCEQPMRYHTRQVVNKGVNSIENTIPKELTKHVHDHVDYRKIYWKAY